MNRRQHAAVRQAYRDAVFNGATHHQAIGILVQAAQQAIQGGPQAVQQFMQAQGFPQDGPWCGEFAAAVVHSAGGTPPAHPEVASNWRNFGSPTNTPHEGDVAIRRATSSYGGRQVSTGSAGSHVTFVGGVDPVTGTFTGVGGNQGANHNRPTVIGHYPISGFDFRTPAGQVTPALGGLDIPPPGRSDVAHSEALAPPPSATIPHESIPFATPPAMPDNTPPLPHGFGDLVQPPDFPTYPAPIPDPTPTVWDSYSGQPVPSPYVHNPEASQLSQIYNPPPNTYELPAPVDTYSSAPLYNPAPWNESPAPVDTYSSYQPTNPEPWNESPTPVDTYGTGTVYGQGSASVGDPFSGASVEGEAPLFDPFAGATVEGEAPFNPFAGATASAAYKQQSSPGGGSSQPPWATAPHTGEVFQATIVDPNTGRISTFDPTTGGYVPVSGPAGWTNTGYGAGSPYGAGSAGYSGGGFGGYGGLGGTGAPVTGHVGGMVDTSTPEGLSHGGVDPTGGSSPGPGGAGSLVKGMTVGEAGIKAEDNAKGIARWDAQQDYLNSLPTPDQQYISGYSWQKNPGWQNTGSQPGSGAAVTKIHGIWSPQYTADQSLAIQAPTTPGWQTNKNFNWMDYMASLGAQNPFGSGSVPAPFGG